METDWSRKKFSHHYDDFEPASGSDGEDEEDEALFSDIHLQQTTMKKKTKKRKRKKKANNSQRNNVRKRKLSKLQSPRKPRTKKRNQHWKRCIGASGGRMNKNKEFMRVVLWAV